MPKSTTFTMACSTAGKMRVPPGVPNAMNGLPSFRTTVGDTLLSMRLCGAMELALPGCGSNSAMVLLRIRPVPGTVTLEPNSSLMVCVMATTLPWSSATVRCVVLPDSPLNAAGSPARWVDGRARSISPRRARAYSLEVRPASGIRAKAGSAMYSNRSA